MVSKLQKMSNFLLKSRDYITLVAYGIVLADVLELAKDVATEWLIHKRFNQLVQRHNEEVNEVSTTGVGHVSIDGKWIPEVDNLPKSDDFFNEVENVTSTEVNVTNTQN